MPISVLDAELVMGGGRCFIELGRNPQKKGSWSFCEASNKLLSGTHVGNETPTREKEHINRFFAGMSQDFLGFFFVLFLPIRNVRITEKGG